MSYFYLNNGITLKIIFYPIFPTKHDLEVNEGYAVKLMLSPLSIMRGIGIGTFWNKSLTSNFLTSKFQIIWAYFKFTFTNLREKNREKFLPKNLKFEKLDEDYSNFTTFIPYLNLLKSNLISDEYVNC